MSWLSQVGKKIEKAVKNPIELIPGVGALNLISSKTGGTGSIVKDATNTWNTLSGKDAEKAAQEAQAAQAAAGKNALEEQARQFNIGQENIKPWLTAGTGALTEQQKLMGINGYNSTDSMNALQSSPGYTFRLSQGNRGLNALAGARGGMASGKAMTAASDWNQNQASNEYTNRLNQLSTLSNTGQTTADQLNTLGANYATNYGNTVTNNANAYGAGQIGMSNARQSGLNGLINLGGQIAGWGIK